MQLLKKKGILVFWVILLVDSYFILTKQDSLRFFTKTLLIPILLFYVFLNTRKHHYRTSKILIFFALLAAWIGDILLMFKANTFFIFGMAAFGLMHLLYAYIYYRFHKLRLGKSQEAFVAAIVMFFLCFFLFRYLNKSPEFAWLKIPVIIYMITISLMSVMAANMLGTVSRKYNAINFFLPGAVLFIISDGTLSVQKFVFPDEPFLSVIVMISYGYAQSLIADGFSKILKS